MLRTCGDSDPNFTDLHCMSFTSKDASEVLVAGLQSTMFRIDMDKGALVEIVRSSKHVKRQTLKDDD